ncbi:MAG TPA: LPS assembly lipoprotein LptE [Paucimonas sp.]|nr:LPS assembly lipoprotein LptE [Paucimonas sp.]
MKRRFARTLALAAAITLSACGFHLRGSTSQASLPFATVYLGVPDTSALGAELKRNLRAGNGTQVVDDAKAAQAVVELLSETRDKIVLSRNTQGRIREYSLLYKVTFRVKDGKERQLLAPTEVVLKRDISFNEAQVMAKEKEEEMLYRDMQTDLVQQILRRLAALKPV